MSRKAIAPHGKVTQGDYAGMNVYVWVDNTSLMIVDGIVDRGFLAAPFYERKLIDKSTVVKYTLVSTTKTTGESNRAIGITAMVYGRVAAETLVNSVQIDRYTVVVYFKDGKKCMLELNSDANNTLSSACFQI